MTPHRFCLLNDAHLLIPIVIANLAIAYAYIRIPIALIKLVGRLNLEPETREAIRLSWAFILSCAVTHLVSILVLFIPAYRLEAVILALCAVISLLASSHATSIAETLPHPAERK